MNFVCKQYNVSIYGDGEKEYEGYYLVILDEFDEFDNPTRRKHKFYVKATNRNHVVEFVEHMIYNGLIQCIGINEKIKIRKYWEMIEEN